jgi:CMP/dCMP kinase
MQGDDPAGENRDPWLPLGGAAAVSGGPAGVLTASIITIDGPAAAGKSVLGQRLAHRLGYLYFDTGVLYRAVAWLALKRGVRASDGSGLTRLAQQANIGVEKPACADGRQYTVTVDGADVTWEIRGADVEAIVSPVAATPGVREALRERQRQIGLAGKVVMVGRDIGTVVLPEADLKVYLTASPEERARRRYLELRARGAAADMAAVRASIDERDRIDSQRSVAPLKPADDALVIDSDGLSIEEELGIISDCLASHGAGGLSLVQTAPRQGREGGSDVP